MIIALTASQSKWWCYSSCGWFSGASGCSNHLNRLVLVENGRDLALHVDTLNGSTIQANAPFGLI